MSARYLLRLDDACPTMSSERWRRFEVLFDELGVRPIVAIVPENHDPELSQEKADPAFWERARSWQARGWTIALHGHQHLLRPTKAAQYLPFYRKSEFAGLPYAAQAEKISSAWQTMVSHDLQPRLWVAPAHSFDETTLRALQAETPIRIVSDGIARKPYEMDGFIWLPQQLWSLTEKRSGLWTVCLHPNSMGDREFGIFAQMLRSRFAGAVASVDDLSLACRRKDLADHVEALRFWSRHYFYRAAARAKALVRK